MALGGEGVISVAANQVPGPMHDLAAACARGDFAEARRIHYRLLQLMNLNFVESNPIPVKASLALMGLCEESFRLPMCPPTEATREALRAAPARSSGCSRERRRRHDRARGADRGALRPARRGAWDEDARAAFEAFLAALEARRGARGGAGPPTAGGSTAG